MTETATAPPGDAPEYEYEGHVVYADGSLVSLQCYDGDCHQCPDTGASDAEPTDDPGPLDGYYCEHGCNHAAPRPQPAAATA